MTTYDGLNSYPVMTTTYLYHIPCYNEVGVDELRLPTGGAY